ARVPHSWPGNPSGGSWPPGAACALRVPPRDGRPSHPPAGSHISCEPGAPSLAQSSVAQDPHNVFHVGLNGGRLLRHRNRDVHVLEPVPGQCAHGRIAVLEQSRLLHLDKTRDRGGGGWLAENALHRSHPAVSLPNLTV